MADTKLKIGQIGEVVKINKVEQINYFSDRNFLDFDVLLVKASYLVAELDDQMNFVQPSHYKAYDGILTKAKEVINDFFRHGGLVFLFMDIDPSRKKATVIDDFQMSKEDPLSLVMLNTNLYPTLKKQGNEFGPMNEIEELGRIFGFKYKFLWERIDGVPLVKPKRGDGFTAFKKKVESGYVYCLPEATRIPALESTTASYANFLVALIKLVELNQVSENSSITEPEWIERFVIGNEPKYAAIKQELLKKKAELEIGIQENERSLDEYRAIKRLIFAGDAALENAVEMVFREFGFNVTVPEGNKDDLNIIEDDFKAVFEVKGLTKSASTTNAMQLEKWATNYAIENNTIIPKAILIVNAFKELEPSARKEKPFPKDLLDFSIPRRHCLMLTLDLLHIYVDFKASMITKDEIRTLLDDAIGVLDYTPRFQPD